ncbi:DNA cytosine methyltransferase [Eubacterium barkeri]|uniref:DNA (cytosine-5-)-methyltransferase n=1 Tax=Eubacterium barkeri TaxID=1528 RepID=A0A1H3ISA2_EUBBA|nr:DNA cytosine methyltransferase [Eubacterium barkeri]SDY29744.1 DNA (cytosine-5)-methyltransferase 1 [Eubacterium barkeri]
MGLIVDNFAGGGGASVGIEQAMGRPIDIAINHDPEATAMHMVNHPKTRHYTEDVWEIDPVKVCGGQPVDLAWFSPDCKHFSKAKGGKPKSKKIRGLAWVAIRWAVMVRPSVIILENVEEFKTWGPLDDDGNIIDGRKGETFHSFVEQLKNLGYKVDYQELVACDFGAPTTRKRFFLVARSDGKEIIWPKKTHGPGLKPYKTAASIINWNLPCPSIFDTTEDIKEKYGIRAVRPLAQNTMNRIARGLKKFVMDNPKPYIVDGKHTPFMTAIGQTGFTADRSYGCNEPIRTIVSKAEQCLIMPTLIQYHTETQKDEVRGQNIDEPIMTIDSNPRYGLVTAFIQKYFGGGYTGAGSKMDDPLGTVTAVDHNSLCLAYLIKYYGQGIGQPANNPMGTITSKERFGLVTVHGIDYCIVDIGMRMLTPRELFNAQGFPPDYIIDHDINGKKLSKSTQVARCGNAVPPAFSRALVMANCNNKVVGVAV